MQQESIQIKGFSHAAIGIRDPDTQKDFYINKMGLDVVAETPECVYLRATGNHHYVLGFDNNHKKGLHHMAYGVKDDEEIDRAKHIWHIDNNRNFFFSYQIT